MSRTFQFTVPDDLGIEIEQCAFGKGKTASEYVKNAVIVYTEKNGLTLNQRRRIKDKYQDKAFFLSELALKPDSGGQNESDVVD